MLLDGERTSGQDVRTANVTAAMAIANIVKSSLGPVGLDKMLVRGRGRGRGRVSVSVCVDCLRGGVGPSCLARCGRPWEWRNGGSHTHNTRPDVPG